MVKNKKGNISELDNMFHALSDPTRRKILETLIKNPKNVSEIAKPYKISLVAISKHIKVLERAKLIRRQKIGREYIIRIHSMPLKSGYKFIETFKKDWARHLDALEKFVERNS